MKKGIQVPTLNYQNIQRLMRTTGGSSSLLKNGSTYSLAFSIQYFAVELEEFRPFS
ncbi:MAG: hypothetical protein AAFN93_12470 [Bacteroidota bacterium]